MADALTAEGVSKTFGATVALSGAGLQLARGTIHALLGGNGSGKSTFIKCLAGVYRADSGTFVVNASPVAASGMTPQHAHRLHLRFVHQDLGLFPDLTVRENVALLSGYPTSRGTHAVAWRALDRRVVRLLERYEIEARPSDLVAALRPSQRSMLAVARALEDQVGTESILLLDEPTATLAEHEAKELLSGLRKRADGGQTIALVSHRFSELESVADAVTVFRDGRVVVSDAMASMSATRLIKSMTGGVSRVSPSSSRDAVLPRARTVATTAPRDATKPDVAVIGSARIASMQARCSVKELFAGAARGVTFDVSRGEVVGLVGLSGSGKSSVLRALFGAIRVSSGKMRVDGSLHSPADCAAAMAAQIAYVPEDRHGEAAFLDMSVRENLNVSVLKRFWRRLRMDVAAERRSTRSFIDAFGIRTQGSEVSLGSLSGGNQQKVMLARWIQRDPRLLLLDEPTQGVDIVARAEIYAIIASVATSDCAVLIASSDLEELLEVADRVVILRAGHVVAERSTSQTNRDELARLMMLDEKVPR